MTDDLIVRDLERLRHRNRALHRVVRELVAAADVMDGGARWRAAVTEANDVLAEAEPEPLGLYDWAAEPVDLGQRRHPTGRATS